MAAPSAPAHTLWVELSTRITTQKLHYRSGDEETAAISVYKLFDKMRELMEANQADKEFIRVALSLMNDTLRPYTARWHGWMVEDKDAAPDKDGKRRSMFMNPWVRRKFREELRELRAPLEQYVSCLDALRNGTGLSEGHKRFLKDREERTKKDVGADLGADLEMKIGHEVVFYGANSETTIADINKAESAEVLERRNLGKELTPRIGSYHDLDSPRPPGTSAGKVMNATALALSGGGIRSATFCLGVVQALAKRGLFSQFDLMSTVSGGGYFGSFLSTYLGVDVKKMAAPTVFKGPQVAKTGSVVSSTTGADGKICSSRLDGLFGCEPAVGAPAPAPAAGAAGLEKGPPESPVLRHLRTNSKYLLNGGAVGRWTIFGLVVSGVLYNLLLLLPYPVVGALLAAGAWQWGWWDSGNMFWPWQEGWWTRDGWLSKAWMLFAMPLVFVLLLLPRLQSWAHGAKGGTSKAWWKGWCEVAALALALFTALGLVVCYLPAVFSGYDQLLTWLQAKVGDLRWDKIIAAISGLVTMLTGPAALKRSDTPKGAGVRKWMMRLFILSGPIFFMSLFLLVGNRLGFKGDEPSACAVEWSFWTVSWVALVLLVWSLTCININTLAPHRYYRARLCECYLAVKGWSQRTLMMRIASWWKREEKFGKAQLEENGDDKIGSVQKIPLASLSEDHAAPYHLINAIVNLPSSHDSAVKGRQGDFFLFSKHFCGSPVVGYVPTHQMVEKDPHLDLGTAMAISGAAASTNMGWKTLKHFRFLLALLNVRLGYWVPNPHLISDKSHRIGPGLTYFFREITGWMHEKSKYLNLSDGGHIENLAVYELLRRKCKFILCVDAGMEPGMECTDLMRLQRYAKVDFGIHMHFDPTDLTVLPTRFSRAYAVLVKIDYDPPKKQAPPSAGDPAAEELPVRDEASQQVSAQAVDVPQQAAASKKTASKKSSTESGNPSPKETSDQLGWMLYIKLAVTGTEPRYVLDYRRENPDFPHQSTGDQLYDEAQFEAYRALGEVAAASLFRTEIVGSSLPTSIEGWFKNLADSLLPDNDEAFRK